MVLRIITIFALSTSNAILCMDNNNNNFDDEIKIDHKISNDANQEHLKIKIKRRFSSPHLETKQNSKEFESDSNEDFLKYRAAIIEINNLGKQEDKDEKSYTSTDSGQELITQTSKKSLNPKAQEAANKFKQAMADKYLGVAQMKKAPSQSSADFLQISKYGMENDGQ